MASTCGHNYGQQCKCNLRNTVYGLSGNTHLSKRQTDVSTGLGRIPNKSLEKIYRWLFPYLEQEIRFYAFFLHGQQLGPVNNIHKRRGQQSANSFTLNPQNSDIIPLVITNNPNHTIDFNHIKNLINNVKCPRLKRAFKNKPLLSTRQPPNLKRLLTRAEYNPEEEQGVIPCTRPNCDLCRLGYLKIQTEVKSPTGATLFKLYKRFHCNSMNILYLLTCPVCNKQYVGKTEDCRHRMNNHKKDVRNPKQKTLYADKHFKNCLIQKFGELKEPLFFCTPFLYVKDPIKRHNLEQFYIKKFKTELNK